MVMEKELKVGDKFVVVGRRTSLMNCQGEIDKYLGQILTIRGVSRIRGVGGVKYKCIEDMNDNINGWDWFDEMIDWDATDKLNNPKPVDLLKNGMVVEFTDGERYLVLKGELETERYGVQEICFIDNRTFMIGTYYNEDLKTNEGTDYDIDKIYAPTICGLSSMFKNCNEDNLIWERPEQKTIKLTSSELLEKLGLDKNTKVEIEW
jgi:hypothetical protein